MTREEAIDILDDNFTVIDTHGHYTDEEVEQARQMAIKALEQEQCDKCEVGNPCLYCKNEFEPKYCDRNICIKNEYNGIGCDECEVTKSQEPKTWHWVHNKCDKCGASRPPLLDNYCPNCGAKMERSDKE